MDIQSLNTERKQDQDSNLQPSMTLPLATLCSNGDDILPPAATLHYGSTSEGMDTFCLNIARSEHGFSSVFTTSANTGVSSLAVSVPKDVSTSGFVPIPQADTEESSIERSSDRDDEPVECGECNKEFVTLQEYMEHPCARSESGSRAGQDENNGCLSESELSEGESFDGKIVYNPDGSAYIIEGADSDQSDIDSLVDLPNIEGSIVDKKGKTDSSKVSIFPQIANAFFVPRNPTSLFNNFYLMSPQKIATEAPIMHSYRVYDVRSANENSSTVSDKILHSEDSISTSKAEAATVPTKPILMCFICKLSFGYTKSFIAHAVGEHSMELNNEEKAIMAQKNASAIIQGIGKDKQPLMSFLEPNSLSISQNNLTNSVENSHLTSSVHNSGIDNASLMSCSFGKSNNLECLPTSGHFISQNSVIASINVPHTLSLLTSSTCDTQLVEPTAQLQSSTIAQSASSPTDSFADIQSTQNEVRNETKASADDSELEKSRSEEPDCSSPSVSNSNHMTVNNCIMTSTMPGIPGFLGACDEHPQGRAQGVECPKCDMVLSSSQSLGGHMTMMHSRNSCKTLKCPKCNWHYKYQETLEIHMKEKHPENDTQCIYCVTNQPHPRLARGETYACGYKPYRCEVCNYSTTTKGNLSIHMQSDKHLNNVQELANGGDIKMPTQSFPENTQMKKNKPKPTWRCDVCNYETNVARNLRIHMTSEKHTHNMMALQQNMKHMQGDLQLQMNPILMLGHHDPCMLGLPSPLTTHNSPLSYDHAFLQHGLSRNIELPVDLTKENDIPGISFASEENINDGARLFQCCVCNMYSSDLIEALHQHIQVDRTKQHENDNIIISAGTYLCNLCTYKTNLKTNFYLHLKTDKHLQRLQLVNHIKEGGNDNEWRLKYLTVSNPVLVRCNSCDFCTNSIHKLQMHTSTPHHENSAHFFQHLQICETKLSASVKEYQCILCNYSTKSKLNVLHHIRTVNHLQNESLKQMQLKEHGKTLELDLNEVVVVKEDSENGATKTVETDGDGDKDQNNALDQVEEKPSEVRPDIQAAVMSPGSLASGSASTGAAEIQEQSLMCPYCNYTSVSEMRIQAHVLAQHMQKSQELLCPLCQDEFKEKNKLEKHLVQVHSVTPEGLNRLLTMVDQDWLTASISKSQPTILLPFDESGEINTEALEAEAARLAEDALDTAVLLDKGELDDQYRCQTCTQTFSNIDALYAHQNDLGHLELKQTPRGPGYLCWKKGCNQYFKTAHSLQVHFREIHAKRQQVSISERHIYKYRCNQCSLAFKTIEKLQLHSHYHLIREATRCNVCGRGFRSIIAVRKHVEATHADLGENELEKYRNIICEHSLALTGSTGLEKMALGSFNPPTTQSNVTVVFPIACKSPMPESIMKPSSSSETLATQTTTTITVKTEPLDSTDSENCYEPLEMNLIGTNTMMNGETKRENSTSCQEQFQESEESVCDSLNTYKDQQFLEDYMNSQSIAEGSYEDPSRKFKCHRCKVAFTKQSYLTAHNKTLQHRKGDKLSYPMEKYLDPNRPYKCDVCKESFTQKNILLVHYNSVSHLHKLKQAAQQGNLPGPIPSTSPSSLSQTAVTENEKKPYRCNLCKVAYNQGSTLDIHIRSVLHQTRASKLQEYAMTGQVDLSQPLIEQPDVSKSQETSPQHQHIQIQLTSQSQQLPSPSSQKQTLSEMLQSKQTLTALNSTLAQPPPLLFPNIGTSISGIPSMLSALSGVQTVSHLTTSPSQQDVTATSSSLDPLPASSIASSGTSALTHFTIANITGTIQDQALTGHKSNNSDNTLDLQSPKSSTSTNSVYNCHRCCSVFNSPEALLLHQQSLGCMSSGTTSPVSQACQSLLKSRNYFSRYKLQVQRNLLENIGFECVMQFNEFNQPTGVERVKESTENPIEEEDERDCEQLNDDLPEINRSVCDTCGKEFSSVWVLKAHQEEIHKVVVPIKFIEKFGTKFKSDYEKKQPKEIEPPSSCSLPLPLLVTSAQTPTLSIASQASQLSEKILNQDLSLVQTQADLSQMMPMFNMMPMPVPLNMNVAMGLHPHLMPMMAPPSVEQGFMPPLSLVDSNFMASQQQAQQAQNQKRARTRINDEQLKILRANFDINNSPSEEQIIQMSEQSGLPQKVIKHWFRNTLFKERQRNKDSPYNFSNPPQTTINLEEYEKTGRIPTPTDNELEIELHLKEETRRELVARHEEQMEEFDFKSRLEQKCSESDFAAAVTSIPLSISTTVSLTPSLSSQIPPTPTRIVVPEHHEKNDHCNSQPSSSSSSSSSSGAGKRANRTRFTDYQIKMLQEYFEQNAYPKDDDLDHLSKVLNLSPRVIVVWFQNARQKARKIYENQSPIEIKENGSPSGSLNRSGPNYQYHCKKCHVVFHRYYDLMKHQKKQACHDGEKVGSSTAIDDDSNSTVTSHDETSISETGDTYVSDLPKNSSKDTITSTTIITTPSSTTTSTTSGTSSNTNNNNSGNYKCEKCNLVFSKYEQWQEHQNVHTLNPNLFSNFPGDSAFAVLENVSINHESKSVTPTKRKALEEEEEEKEQPRDKRLRTTILPEQLDYLYQKYQIDCNPSRKQLETIAQEVGLKKRVVQVWFQNTRARERKGQYRAHQQLIHKRCPFCRALFRAKSALESHLATKHPEEMAKGEINIDNIPDATLDATPPPPPVSQIPTSSSVLPSQSSDLSKLLSPSSMQPFLPFMPQTSIGMSFPTLSDPLQTSMRQFCEASFKKFISELSAASHGQQPQQNIETPLSSKPSETERKSHRLEKTSEDIDAPLDLSKPIKVNTDSDKTSDGPSTDVSERSQDCISRRQSLDDSISETHSENFEADINDDSNIGESSPSSPAQMQLNPPGRRYRTQMSSLQVRVMKTLFADYKTPTMAECEMLGREIGLPKRVIQVWFQNARAKEKKSKLAYAKTFGTDVDFSKPPEECALCNFKYSHKYTVQDHIFTKKHIDNVRQFIQSQTEAERELADPSGMSKMLQQQRELERMRKVWDDAAVAATSPHLAQLQAMRMNALGLQGTSSAFNAPFNAAQLFPEIKKEQPKSENEKKEENKVSSRRESASSMESLLSPHLMSPFAGLLQGFDPGLIPNMYTGLPSFFPGVNLPFFQFGLMPGMEHLLAYDPVTFGTPLSLLQIPEQARQNVSTKLLDSASTVTRYTHDCKTLNDLKCIISESDLKFAQEAIVDVGYICKKCHIVYPGRDGCENHQRLMCFPGGNVSDSIKPILKLEQIQYECSLCMEKMSVLQEFVLHCSLEHHKLKVSRMHKSEQKSHPESAHSSGKEVKTSKSQLAVESQLYSTDKVTSNSDTEKLDGPDSKKPRLES